MLTALGRAARVWAHEPPWTNVYGVARTLLALGTAGTLAASATDTLFRPALGVPPAPYCIGPTKLSLFCLVRHDDLTIARWLAVAVLLVVASGWRPRLTAIPHWWIAFSVQTSMTLVDGGDQVTAVLTLLLLPLALTDPRRWHWKPLAAPEATRPGVAALVASSAVLAIRIQVAAIYLHSSLAKLSVEQWTDGTALYYWLLDPSFGVPPWLRDVASSILASGVAVTALTWGTIALEFSLALGLVLDRRFRPYLLVLGIAFHAGIAVFMGLVSFGLAMCAAVILYLRPVDLPFARPALLFRPARAPGQRQARARRSAAA